MEFIFQRDVFRILSLLVMRREELTSFSTLKSELNLNPNVLVKYLKRLMEFGFVTNYYRKQPGGKHYSFYRITEKGLKILDLQVGVPRIQELLLEFKKHCKSRGWETTDIEDWVKVNGQYHNFLWTRTIHPSTFRKIVQTRKCAIRQGLMSSKVVDVAYTAWLHIGPVPDVQYGIVMENPEFTKTTAIYDLSQAYLTRPVVIRLNKTDSQVFREFESFLQIRWNLKLVDSELFLPQLAVRPREQNTDVDSKHR